MTIRQELVRRISGAIAAGMTVAAFTAQPVLAQGANPAGWSAFLGCWEAIGPDGVPVAGDKTRVCVRPSAGPSAVDVVTVREDRIASTTHLEATGAPQAIGKDGCTGTEKSSWSADRQRVYLSADITCDGVHRTTSGVMALSPMGEWIDVQGVMAGQNAGVHVTRYRPVVELTGIPVEITAALPQGQLAVSTARLAASGTITTDAVVEAVKNVSTPVVEAWLLERGQGFSLSAKQLVALADAGVPGRVTDMMVALSYPKVFAINTSAREATRGSRVAANAEPSVSGRTIPVTAYSPFGWGAYDPYYGSSYGYGYGRGYGYGYSPYGYGYGWYPNQPIIVVRGGGGDGSAGGGSGTTSRPRVVNGRGYTEGTSTPASTGSKSSGSSSSGSSSAGSSSSGSSTSSGSSSSGSSSSGTERTAHRVP
jgi:hypothetical protein